MNYTNMQSTVGFPAQPTIVTGIYSTVTRQPIELESFSNTDDAKRASSLNLKEIEKLWV